MNISNPPAMLPGIGENYLLTRGGLIGVRRLDCRIHILLRPTEAKPHEDPSKGHGTDNPDQFLDAIFLQLLKKALTA